MWVWSLSQHAYRPGPPWLTPVLLLHSIKRQFESYALWWRASARFVLSQGPCTVGVCGLLFLLWVTNGLRCLLLHRGLIVIVVPVLLASACTVEAAVTTPPSPIGTSVCVAEAFGGAEPPPCPAGAVGGMHLRPVPTPVRAGCPLPTVIEEHAVSSRPVQCIALRAAIPLTSWDPDPVDTVDPRAWNLRSFLQLLAFKVSRFLLEG